MIRAWKRNNAERAKKSTIAWRKSHPGCERKWKLKQQYGLSVEDYDRILLQQGGGCAICSRTKEDNGQGFAVDHQHGGANLVRGLLCLRCNRGLGLFKDSEELLHKALAYLRDLPAQKVLNSGQA